MKSLTPLFEANQVWAEQVRKEDPEFFPKLSQHQSPEYLWIGCSDSRVHANEVIGKQPGDVFVHRNIANLVIHTDLNCLSVLQYAVEVLKVKHVIICGHYGCGGVKAAFEKRQHGLIDNWLQHIRDVHRYHQNQLDAIEDDTEKHNRLCELNVIEQVANVCHTTIVQNAWGRNQDLSIHGLMYSLQDGMLHDLDITCTGPDAIALPYLLD